jgi:hypothetical protein
MIVLAEFTYVAAGWLLVLAFPSERASLLRDLADARTDWLVLIVRCL